jgi:hypothetical protein
VAVERRRFRLFSANMFSNLRVRMTALRDLQSECSCLKWHAKKIRIKLSNSTCLEIKMKRGVKAALSMMLLLGSMSAIAGSKLTAEECNDYPFKPIVGEITHAQLEQELAELESVGYEPEKRDFYYPNDLQAAQARLHAKYVADCAPNAAHQGS